MSENPYYEVARKICELYKPDRASGTYSRARVEYMIEKALQTLSEGIVKTHLTDKS